MHIYMYAIAYERVCAYVYACMFDVYRYARMQFCAHTHIYFSCRLTCCQPSKMFFQLPILARTAA